MILKVGSRARWFKIKGKSSLAERVAVTVVGQISPVSVLVRRDDDGTEHTVRAENLMPATSAPQS